MGTEHRTGTEPNFRECNLLPRDVLEVTRMAECAKPATRKNKPSRTDQSHAASSQCRQQKRGSAFLHTFIPINTASQCILYQLRITIICVYDVRWLKLINFRSAMKVHINPDLQPKQRRGVALAIHPRLAFVAVRVTYWQ